MDYKQLFIDTIEKYPNDSKWIHGCFGSIKILSNTAVGNIGQDFICNYATHLGFNVKKPDVKTSWDIEIEGIKYELKTATEDVHGKFQFNHFRTHRSYDAAMCLGVSPDELYFYVISKDNLLRQHLVSMERGANASYKWTRSKNDLWTISSFEEILKEFSKELQEQKSRALANEKHLSEIAKHKNNF